MHSGHRERLRERLRNSGEEAFQDHELLELLLTYSIQRKDVNPLAHKLIDHFGSFSAVMNASFKELESVKGIGESTATLILLVKALHKRVRISSYEKAAKLNTAKDAARYSAELLWGRRIEAFYAIFLNPHHRLIHAQLISEGSPNETSVSPRAIVEAALLHKASSVILAHNHPSGKVSPSPDDIKMTNTIKRILASIDIMCDEHIIVGIDKAYAIVSEIEFNLNGSEFDSNEAGEIFVPEQYNDPYKMIAMLKAMDKESLGILIGSIADLKDEWE